jgi:hypothetical protein
MAQVVELFGAPGTGKSSLVRALDGRRVAGRTLVAAQRLTRVPRVGRIRTGPVRLAGRTRLTRTLTALLTRELTPGERRAALARRRDDWSALLELIASAPLGRDDADPLRGLHAPGWLAASLELRALADAAPDGLVVLLDEGLVQRSALACGVDPDDATLDRYLERLPPATLHVHLTADPSALVARLRARTRVIDRHAGLDDAGLGASVVSDTALFARAAGRLAGSGHDLLAADTSAVAVGTLADDVARRLGATLDGTPDRARG